ncbi:MAG: methyltransferase domain-containing protein [Anaerolineae bacterium]|nr:methyltransferase domain-containing protein [Anaerolineae bacterium]
MAAELFERLRAISRRPLLRAIVGTAVVLLSFGYLGFLLFRNWDELLAYEWHVVPGQIALAFCYYSLALLFAVLAWSRVAGRLTPVKSLRKHMKYYIYTNLLRRLPAPLLNFFGRAYFYQQEGIAGRVMVAVSLLEWMLVVLSGIVVYLLTMPFLPLPALWRSPWLPAVILLVGALLVRPRTVQSVLRLLGKEGAPLDFGYGDLLGWLALYALVWIAGGLVLYAVINSLYPLPLSQLPAVMGIWALSGLVPTLILITPVGFGLKEVTMGVLLSYLIPPSLAVVVALLMRVELILFELIWGGVALLLRPAPAPPTPPPPTGVETVAKETVHCPLCHADQTTPLFETPGQALQTLYADGKPIAVQDAGRIVRCQGCGLVYVNPRVASAPGLSSYTLEQEQAYFDATRAARQGAYAELLLQLQRRLGHPGRLLDVGFGDGLLLALARDDGWDTAGVEVSRALVERARSTYGLERLFHGPLQRADYPDACFDAVVLVNVIEHLRDPAAVMAEVARLLAPGGIAAIHTVNVDSLAARLQGVRWHHFEPHEHFFYFDRRTLGAIVSQAGLTPIEWFRLWSPRPLKRGLIRLAHCLGLYWDNGLGLLARKPAAGARKNL